MFIPIHVALQKRTATLKLPYPITGSFLAASNKRLFYLDMISVLHVCDTSCPRHNLTIVPIVHISQPVHTMTKYLFRVTRLTLSRVEVMFQEK